jgi:AraC-like DNA-binding protein
LVVQNGQVSTHDTEDVFNQLPDWNIHFHNLQQTSPQELAAQIRRNEIHFLLYSTELHGDAGGILSRLHQEFPLLYIIYYYSQLKSGEFAELYQAGINYCIVGDARQIHLIKSLNQLWDRHWRRIPAHVYGNGLHPFPERAVEILNFIEKKPIRYFNSLDIAGHLNISESRFRTEFKRFFNVNFREFKQQLYAHYESVLIFDKKLKPKEIFNILDYKNISAFSRSFRMRHGKSWQQLMRSELS